MVFVCTSLTVAVRCDFKHAHDQADKSQFVSVNDITFRCMFLF